MPNTLHSSKHQGPYTKSISRLRAVLALCVLVFLASSVGLILTTITNQWWLGVYSAIAVTVLLLVGWTVRGYGVQQTILTILHGRKSN